MNFKYFYSFFTKFFLDKWGIYPIDYSQEMKRTDKLDNLQVAQNEPRSRNSKKGFSLVEMMVGSAVLTLVLAGSFSGLGQALLIQENVQSSNFATQLLQSEMDEIHLLNWSEISRLQGTGNFDPRTNFSTVPLRDYTCTRVVSTLGTTQKEIRLEVGWTDMRGKTHSQSYVTYYTKDGLFDYSYRAL